jgi:hypothetical protein
MFRCLFLGRYPVTSLPAKIYYKPPPVDPVLSQMKSVHILASNFINTLFNINLQPMSK